MDQFKVSRHVINAAYNKGFMCSPDVVIYPSQHGYLWMCEVQKWLRDKHNLLVEVYWNGTDVIDSWNYRLLVLGKEILSQDYRKIEGSIDAATYEECLETAIKEALKLVK